ncbi:MAG: hypothetical protein ACTHOK_09205 [Nocardioidaceae bacterium]
MILFAVLLLSVLAVGGMLAFGLRRVTFDEVHAEQELERPGAHRVSYVVPPGEDAALVMAALIRAGYTAVGGQERGVERVLVRCEADQRADVRRVIEHAEQARSTDPEMYVGHVRFEDER